MTPWMQLSMDLNRQFWQSPSSKCTWCCHPQCLCHPDTGLSPSIWQHFWGLSQRQLPPWPMLHLQGWEDNTLTLRYFGDVAAASQHLAPEKDHCQERFPNKSYIKLKSLSHCSAVCLCLLDHCGFFTTFLGLRLFFFFPTNRVHKISVSEMRLKDSCVIPE